LKYPEFVWSSILAGIQTKLGRASWREQNFTERGSFSVMFLYSEERVSCVMCSSHGHGSSHTAPAAAKRKEMLLPTTSECTEDRGGRLQSCAVLNKIPWTGVAQWLRG